MTTSKTAAATIAKATPERQTYVFTTSDGAPMYVDLTPDQSSLMDFLRSAGLLDEDVEWELLENIVHQTP